MPAMFVVAAVVGYLLGAIPVGYLVARAKGVNIFEVGSKNPGATNVRRVLGAGPGNLVFALDALKGAVAAFWPLQISFVPSLADHDGSLFGAIAGFIFALIGHSFSCFTKFRGGKGVATASGGLLVLLPLSAVICIAIWMAAFFLTRYVSVASILAALALPLSAWALGRPNVLIAMGVLVGAIVILRHRANISRLLNGTENKFVKKSPSSSAT